MASINDMKIGASAKVTGLSRGCALSQRLMAMGLLPGVLIKLVRVAPLGDPITLDLNGSQISIRRSEAAGLTIDEHRGDSAK